MAKRTGGYAITIKGFIPIAKGNLDAQIEVASALKTALGSQDISSVSELLTNVKIEATQVSRMVDDGQTDLEDAVNEAPAPRGRGQRQPAQAPRQAPRGGRTSRSEPEPEGEGDDE
jgi:hypothetical protein